MIGRILFLMERYCDADPKCGPSNSEHQIVEGIKSTGLVGETKHFYFDEMCKRFGREKMTALLFQDCQVFQPDLVVYTPLGGALGDRVNPPPEAIRRIADQTKLYLTIGDSKPACGIDTKWFPCADHVGINDSVTAYQYYKGSPKAIMTYRPASPSHFWNKGTRRDIDVSFVGSIDPTDMRWPPRYEYTQFLRQSGIGIFIGGGQRANNIPTEEYCDILNRSKISLGFCRDGNNLPLLKQKVFEITSCGAFLMDDWGTHALAFLRNGEDFIIFHSKEEMLRLVRYFLEHDAERERIARSGHEKAKDIYNVTNFWGYTFEKIGFELPGDLANDKNYLLHRGVMEGL